MKKSQNAGGQTKTFSPIGSFCVIYKANSSGQSLIHGDFPLPHSSGAQRLLHISTCWHP